MLAAALTALTGTRYEAFKLPFTTIDFSADEQSVMFGVGARRFTCDVGGAKCSGEAAGDVGTAARGGGRGGRGGRGGAVTQTPSPDGKKAAFIRDYNLWVRDVATGQETRLTTDGVKDFGYATDNAGWSRSDRPILLWSPDSKKIATFQQDERGVGDMYLVNTQVGHPVLQAWHYPLPGDSIITTIQRVVIDVPSAHVVRLQMPPDQHRSTLPCRTTSCLPRR